MKGSDADSGGPDDLEEPTGECPDVEAADDAPLAHVLPFVIPEIPFDGLLICPGSAYGERLASIVPIAGRRERREIKAPESLRLVPK